MDASADNSNPPLRTAAECAAVLRAMGDESRLRILRALFEGEHSVTEICRALDVEQHFASRHLAVLRNVGLVVSRREAQRKIYAVHPDVHNQMLVANGSIDLGCCEVRFRPVSTATQS